RPGHLSVVPPAVRTGAHRSKALGQSRAVCCTYSEHVRLPFVCSGGMSHVRLGHFSGHTNELLEAFDRAAARRQAGAYRELAGDEAMLVDFTSGPLKDLLDALSDFR